MPATLNTTAAKTSQASGTQGRASRQRARNSTIPPAQATRKPRGAKRTTPAATLTQHAEGEEAQPAIGAIDLQQVKEASLKKHNIEEFRCSHEPDSEGYRKCAEARTAIALLAKHGRKKATDKSELLGLMRGGFCPLCQEDHKVGVPRHLGTHLCTGHQLFRCKYPQCGKRGAQRCNMVTHFAMHERRLSSTTPASPPPRRTRRTRRAPAPPRERPAPALSPSSPTSHSPPMMGPPTTGYNSNTPSESRPPGSSMQHTLPTPAPWADNEPVRPTFKWRNEDFATQYANAGPQDDGSHGWATWNFGELIYKPVWHRGMVATSPPPRLRSVWDGQW